MKPPRPNTQLAELAEYLDALARDGADMPPVVQVAERFDLSAGRVRDLLQEGVARGLWKIARGEGGAMSAVYHPAGKWVLRAAAQRQKPAQVQPRKCLRCREIFRPDHRTNFLCEPCGLFARTAG